MSFQKKETENNWVSDQTCCLGFLMLAQRAHSPSSWKKAGTAAAVEKMHSGFGVLVTTFFDKSNCLLTTQTCLTTAALLTMVFEGVWWKRRRRSHSTWHVDCGWWQSRPPTSHLLRHSSSSGRKKVNHVPYDSQIYASFQSAKLSQKRFWHYTLNVISLAKHLLNWNHELESCDSESQRYSSRRFLRGKNNIAGLFLDISKKQKNLKQIF